MNSENKKNYTVHILRVIILNIMLVLICGLSVALGDGGDGTSPQPKSDNKLKIDDRQGIQGGDSTGPRGAT